jgi:serine/threonine protein phosphatase PrpC
MIDGGLNDEIPSLTSRKLPEIVASQQGISSEPEDALKYTVLKCHETLEALGQKVGASIALMRITDDATASTGYRLSVANVGHCEAVLCRNGRPIALTVSHALTSKTKDEYARIRKANSIVTEVSVGSSGSELKLMKFVDKRSERSLRLFATDWLLIPVPGCAALAAHLRNGADQRRRVRRDC